MVELEYWVCSECEYDTVTVPLLRTPICPLCAGDNGRDVLMRLKPISEAPETVEGKDARKDGEAS